MAAQAQLDGEIDLAHAELRACISGGQLCAGRRQRLLGRGKRPFRRRVARGFQILGQFPLVAAMADLPGAIDRGRGHCFLKLRDKVAENCRQHLLHVLPVVAQHDMAEKGPAAAKQQCRPAR